MVSPFKQCSLCLLVTGTSLSFSHVFPSHESYVRANEGVKNMCKMCNNKKKIVFGCILQFF